MDSRNKAPRGSKTSWSQYAVMVNFLEIPFNFNLVNGKGTDNLKGKGVVVRAKVTKEAGYADLRDMVNSKCGTNWTAKTAKDRFIAMIKKYKTTKRNFMSGNGKKYGLGEADYKKGINNWSEIGKGLPLL